MIYTVIVGGKAVVVGANKVQIVLNGSVVELLKHIGFKVVIRLEDAHVLAGRIAHAHIHGMSVTAVGLIDYLDAAVI